MRSSGYVRSGLAVALLVLTGCEHGFADTRTNIPAHRLDASLAKTTGRETTIFCRRLLLGHAVCIQAR